MMRLMRWWLACGLVAVAGSLGRAETFAGIEIGAKGIKFTVVDAAPTPEGIEFRVVGSGDGNATLVAGLASAGQFKPEGLREAAELVNKFHDEIKGKYQVRPANVFLVGSSGIFSPIEAKPEAVKESQAALAKFLLEATKLKIDFIDVKREAELSIKGMVPNRFREEALLIDVGSGNTKGGVINLDGTLSTFGVPYGTSGVAAKLSGASSTFGERLQDFKTTTLLPALKKEFTAHPEFARKSRIYLSGGIVYAVTALTDVGRKKPYHPITLDQLQQLEARLSKSPDAIPMPDLTGIRDEESKAAATRDLDRVKKLYKPEQLRSGLEILRTTLGELDAGKKSLFFVREGHIGWISAYVAEKVK